MDSQSGNGRPLKMNRQDAKDAKEIENLEKVVIGASIGFGLHESNGLAGARKGALLQASPPGNGCRSVRSLSESKSGSGSIPAQYGTWPSERSPATEITENTEAKVPFHLKATRLNGGLSRRWLKEESLCDLSALCG